MKRILTTLAILAISLTAYAQNERELEINYIAHDHFTSELLNVIDNLYQTNAFKKNKTTYLYLANAANPIILKLDSRNQKAYESFRDELNKQIKHNIWPEKDIQGIIDLLRADDFIDARGKKRYDFFFLNFYITPSFWSYNYNETLIARLLWDLELPGKDGFQVTIYHPENDGYDYDEEHMFGPKKLNGDYTVYLLTY